MIANSEVRSQLFQTFDTLNEAVSKSTTHQLTDRIGDGEALETRISWFSWLIIKISDIFTCRDSFSHSRIGRTMGYAALSPGKGSIPHCSSYPSQKRLETAAKARQEQVEKTKRVSQNWAKLIAKIYEADPLLCTSCKSKSLLL